MRRMTAQVALGGVRRLGRELHQSRSGEVEPAPQRADRLGQPLRQHAERLGRADAVDGGRVEHVEVDVHVDGARAGRFDGLARAPRGRPARRARSRRMPLRVDVGRLAVVEGPRSGEHQLCRGQAGSARPRRVRPDRRPRSARRTIPQKAPEGDESTSLRSPCASNHTTATSPEGCAATACWTPPARRRSRRRS